MTVGSWDWIPLQAPCSTGSPFSLSFCPSPCYALSLSFVHAHTHMCKNKWIISLKKYIISREYTLWRNIKQDNESGLSRGNYLFIADKISVSTAKYTALLWTQQEQCKMNAQWNFKVCHVQEFIKSIKDGSNYTQSPWQIRI